MNEFYQSAALLADIKASVSRALAEDVGSGDVTAALIPESVTAQATVISREAAILCGISWFNEVFQQLDDRIQIIWQSRDGDVVHANQVLCHLAGPAQSILTGERTALNFIQLLSGTATAVRRFADAIAGTRAVILDTRKTLPGLRLAQKYAVRCGGGQNHRLGLFDAVLIKENHIMAVGSITEAVQLARQHHPHVPVEIEVENLMQLQEALATTPDIIMLDNFDLTNISEAVALTAGRVKLEVSGNITLSTVRTIAETGVDYISIGGLTKDVTAIDLSMRFQMQGIGRGQ